MFSPNTHKLSQNKNKVLTVRNILGLLKVSDDSYMVRYAFFFFIEYMKIMSKQILPGNFNGYFPGTTSAYPSFLTLPPITFPIPTIIFPIIWFRSCGQG